MSIDLIAVRSLLIRHAAEEHLDYHMLEHDFASVGGDPRLMASTPKNIGSEAFSAFMFHQASQADPLDLFGAMFVIEGLGACKAARWAEGIKASLGIDDGQVRFLAYHGVNDDTHYDKLRGVLTNPLIDRPLAERLVRTAKVVARLCAAARGAGERLMATARRDRDNPGIWDAMAADPLLHVEDRSRALQVADSRRWTRRHLRPVTRALCMVVVWTALFVKRTVPPLRRGSEAMLNRIGPRFMQQWTSPKALELVLRHFAIETQLLNFVARNSGGAVPEADLRPGGRPTSATGGERTRSSATTPTCSTCSSTSARCPVSTSTRPAGRRASTSRCSSCPPARSRTAPAGGYGSTSSRPSTSSWPRSPCSWTTTRPNGR